MQGENGLGQYPLGSLVTASRDENRDSKLCDKNFI